MPDIRLPDEVIALLDSLPPDGGRQAVQPLFSVDDQGRPPATPPSARQWWTGDGRLVCVLTAGHPSSHLALCARALLVAAARQAYSVRLRVALIQEVGDRRVAVVFDVTAVDHAASTLRGGQQPVARRDGLPVSK
jgi:hypothetical protein